MKPTRLYIKRHNVSRIKYLGKTTLPDPYTYEGSGVLWKKHIKKYGKDISTLWVSEVFTDKDLLIEFATFLSQELDIVKSNEWANLMEENGIGGGTFGIGEKNVAKLPSVRKKISESLKGHNYGMTGLKHSSETRKLMSISAKNAGTGLWLKGTKKSKSHKNNLSKAAMNRKKEKCIYCDKLVSVNVLNRWHNENCKENRIA